MLLARQPAHAGRLQKLVERGARELGGDRHRRHVAAAHRRFLRGDRPLEAAVEVLGVVGAERGRRVFQDAARMQHALVECEAVDEGLEGRAG